ncbi:hypothetical protein EPN96_03640 [bacterium]|nr:MAG: hypothetical protein EPN96_03640 [bacterium]
MRNFKIFFYSICLFLAIPCSAAQFREVQFPPLNQAERDFIEARSLGADSAGKGVEIFSRLLLSPDLPADAVRISLAGLLPPEQARPHLEAITGLKPESPFLPEALDLLAKQAEARGDFAGETNFLDRLQNSLTEEIPRAGALLRLASAQKLAGMDKEAAATATRLYVDFAHTGAADAAAKYIADKDADPDKPLTDQQLLTRGKNLLEKGSREKGVAVFKALLARLKKDSPLQNEVNLSLGKALYYLRRYEEALTPLKTAAKSKSDPIEQDARFHHARSLFGLDRGNEGAADLLALAKKYSGNSKAPVWLFQSYRVFEGRQMAKEAKEARDLLMKKYPASAEAVDTRFGDGFTAFKAGKYADAAKVFESSVKGIAKGWQQARGLYWAFRALEKAQKQEEAKKVRETLLSKYPMGYYSILSASGDGKILPVADPRGKGSMTVTPPSPPAELIVPEGEFEKPLAYLRIGFYEAARRELERLDPKGSSALWMRYFAEDFSGAAKAAGGSWYDWNETTPGKGISDAYRFAYCLAYPYSVNAAAMEADIHPHLLLAVMKTESNFDKDAYSLWEARGLMQFIPSTAGRIAGELGIKDFSQETLFDPSTALRIGAKYLRNLLDLYGGDVASAAAAYNAGESSVTAWREKWKGADADLFVESIPYIETRLYVKKVITALDAYGRLEGGGLVLSSTLTP